MCQFQPFYLASPQTNADSRIVIVGAGLAGLFAALKLSETCTWPIVLLSPTKLDNSSNASSWAQGGIAAAIGPDDSISCHVEDTLAAGAGLNDREVVQVICQEAAAHIEQLSAYGVPFDRLTPDLNSPYALSREAAHSAKRIVRCTGDSSGRMIMESLIAAVRRQPQITVLEGTEAYHLLQDQGRVCGVLYRQLERPPECYQLQAGAVILACGGIGALFEATTNPPSSLGQGLGMAALAGAVLVDSEFVQFHPTTLDLPEVPQPLASEALRGEGATLLDAAGQRFLLRDNATQERAELTSRDVVARAVLRARRESGAAFLDCRHLCRDSSEFALRFPTLWQSAQRHGLDPNRDLLPVIPAAHYHMGGIATDLRGRSSVTGLWAIGEVACTGLHGANRLASNSLLEAVVMASRAAADLAANFCSQSSQSSQSPLNSGPLLSEAPPPFSFQALMSQCIGVERSTSGLLRALRQLWPQPQSNSLVAALCIGCAALLRSESRGSHYYLQGSLPAELSQYSSNGKRSFLDWQSIYRILEKVCQQ